MGTRNTTRARALNLLVVPLVLGLVSCREPYCVGLEASAREERTQVALREWVLRNLAGRRISPYEVLPDGDGVVPGSRWLGEQEPRRKRPWPAATYDPAMLGFDAQRAHVRLIGFDFGDESARAAMFTERSRTGVLVRLPSSESFGLDPSYPLTPVSDDIAVLCDTSD